MTARLIMKMLVAGVAHDTGDVCIYTFRHSLRPELPAATPGAHVDVHLPDGRIRQYSLIGDLNDRAAYHVAIKREDAGRGASRWLHANLIEGTTVPVSAPRNNFALREGARRHILIGGGIGITPLAAMAEHLVRKGEDFILHYCARAEEQAPLLGRLRAICRPDHLRTYFSSQSSGARLDVGAALRSETVSDTHIYCCGPRRLLDSVRQETELWPPGHVHFEAFAPTADANFKPEPFDIKLASTGQTLRVPAGKSALEVLRSHGLALPSSCELGLCGSCECRYTEGIVIHRDSVLDNEARQDRMLLCVSRARVGVTLDL